MKRLKVILSVLIVSFLIIGLAVSAPAEGEEIIEEWGWQDDGLVLTPVAHLENHLLELEITRRDLNMKLNGIESDHVDFENVMTELTFIDDEIATINSQMNQAWATFNQESVYDGNEIEFDDDFYELDMRSYDMQYEPFLPYFEAPPMRM